MSGRRTGTHPRIKSEDMLRLAMLVRSRGNRLPEHQTFPFDCSLI